MVEISYFLFNNIGLIISDHFKENVYELKLQPATPMWSRIWSKTVCPFQDSFLVDSGADCFTAEKYARIHINDSGRRIRESTMQSRRPQW